MQRRQWHLFLLILIGIYFLVACQNLQVKESTNTSSSTPTDQDKKEHIEQPPENNDDHLENTHENTGDEEDSNETYTIDIYNSDSISVLVNKQNSLPDNYNPEDLVTVDVPTILENPEVNQLRKEAASALKDMFDHALADNITLYARSGYRSHQTQVQLFTNYSKRHGEDAANRYSARPGQSEHQTGLVMDVTSESVNFQLEELFGDTVEGQWVQEHAHEFGFIIRYPKDKEEITGYIYEPWHLRYLGVELATAVYESQLTYEEFLVEEGILDDIES